jgi:hypothetical protein
VEPIADDHFKSISLKRQYGKQEDRLAKNVLKSGERQGGAALGHGLSQIDEVSAGVFEKNRNDGADVLWFASEGDAESFQAIVLGLNVIGDEGCGRNAGGEESFLKGLSWREGHGLEDELNPFGAFRSGNGQPTKGGTHGDVLVFHEAQNGGVEAESVILVFYHYAGEADLHGVLLGDLGWQVGGIAYIWSMEDAIIREAKQGAK